MLWCMTDKQLIKQLKSLKKLKPSHDWEVNSRHVLQKQIENSGGSHTSAWQNFYINIKSIGDLAYRPAVGVASFLIVMIGLSFFAHQWLQFSKPNDSLYIARVISERARLTTVLDSTAREKMAAKFAMNHAQDISNLLADPEYDISSSEQMDKLNEDFNREIATVKDRVTSFHDQDSQVIEADDTLVQETSSSSPSYEEDINLEEEDGVITIAENQKDDQGLQVTNQEEDEQEETTDEPQMTDDELETLEEEIMETKKELDEEKDSSPAQLLDEAQNLFLEGEYEKASEKLRTVQEMIK